MRDCIILIIPLLTIFSFDSLQAQEKGLSWDLTYTGEFWSNTQGGIKEDSTYLGNTDLTLTLNTRTLNWWDNGIFFLHLLENHGLKKISADIVGDKQTVSNIEAPRTLKVFELWYEHHLGDDQCSILTGLHDLNTDFNTTEYGGLFINGSFGIQPDISVNARPSIFPLTTFGTRLKVIPSSQWQILLGIYDGNPDSTEDIKYFPRLDFDSQGGSLIISEAVRFFEDGAVKLGQWYNTGEFDDLLETDTEGNPIKHDGNYGFYMVVDKTLYQEMQEQGLGSFIQLGFAPDQINEIDFYSGAGLNYTGLIPGRDNDQLGFAVGYASISNQLKNTRESAETAFELTYKVFWNEHFYIQPDFQYIVNPGADLSLEDSFVTGLRFEINL